MKKYFMLVLLFFMAACSQEPHNTGGLNMMSSIMHEQGIAIKQYDAVSFFSGTPIKGVPEHRLRYKEVEWYFVSEENKKQFEQNPAHYTPQYGGYCALAMSLGQINPSNPETWGIVDGKLYFNSNGFAKWLFGVLPKRQASADSSWKKMRL